MSAKSSYSPILTQALVCWQTNLRHSDDLINKNTALLLRRQDRTFSGQPYHIAVS